MVAPPSSVYPRTDFPEDLECHPLLVVDYAKVAAGDEHEIDQLYQACTALGFFYLKHHGVEHLTEPMFAMGKATFELPDDELMPFEQGDSGMSAGYKRAGSTNVDAKVRSLSRTASSRSCLVTDARTSSQGNVDTVHFINVAKDDALAYPKVRQRTYPRTVVERMDTVTSFVRKCASPLSSSAPAPRAEVLLLLLAADEVLQTLMAALEPRLGLPKGTLAALHKEGDISGSESRCILKPAEGEKGFLAEGEGDDGNPAAAIGCVDSLSLSRGLKACCTDSSSPLSRSAHTDFGVSSASSPALPIMCAEAKRLERELTSPLPPSPPLLSTARRRRYTVLCVLDLFLSTNDQVLTLLPSSLAVSMLHGRGCGGLQVLPPGTTKWQHIRPLPGHAVCNVGDTLSVYSGNIFKSNVRRSSSRSRASPRLPRLVPDPPLSLPLLPRTQIHRVIPPPPPQNKDPRWSLVYFLRPGFDNPLAPLSDKSNIIRQHAEHDPAMQALPKGETAGSWFKRRVTNQRAANRKGPETWAASRGTERASHSPHAPTSTARLTLGLVRRHARQSLSVRPSVRAGFGSSVSMQCGLLVTEQPIREQRVGQTGRRHCLESSSRAACRPGARRPL